jgi:phosphoglycerate dehydrogenase-like enzyme
LVEVLEEGGIRGAVLDVYEKEPLGEESKLWGMENVLMYPHCADQDHEYLKRSFAIFEENLNNFA